jgi:hypothetical protein
MISPSYRLRVETLDHLTQLRKENLLAPGHLPARPQEKACHGDI